MWERDEDLYNYPSEEKSYEYISRIVYTCDYTGKTGDETEEKKCPGRLLPSKKGV